MIATLTPSKATSIMTSYSGEFHFALASCVTASSKSGIWGQHMCTHTWHKSPHHFIMAGMSQLRHKWSQMLRVLSWLKDKGGASGESPLRFLTQKLNPLGTGLVSSIFEIWPVPILATSHSELFLRCPAHSKPHILYILSPNKWESLRRLFGSCREHSQAKTWCMVWESC